MWDGQITSFFVDCVNDVLKDGGIFLLHFISALKEHPGDPWIKKYIFPGGMVPSLREMLCCLSEDNFHTLDVENLRLHYHKTLLCWAKKFPQTSGGRTKDVRRTFFTDVESLSECLRRHIPQRYHRHSPDSAHQGH